MKCPCCNNGWNELKVDYGNIVSCCRFHKFEVTIQDKTGDVVLVFLSPVPNDSGFKVGDTFPVPNGAEFKTRKNVNRQQVF